MRFSNSVLAAVLTGSSMLPGYNAAGSIRGPRQLVEQEESSPSGQMLCRITKVDTLYSTCVDDDYHQEDRAEDEEISCIPIVNNTETDLVLPVSLPEDLATRYKNEIAQGTLLLAIDGASIDSDNDGVILAPNATFSVIDDVPDHQRHLVAKPSVTGKMTLMIVRVVTKDGVSPDMSLYQLRKAVFYNGVSFRTQYRDCSFGQLMWTDAGGMEVILDKPISQYSKPNDLLMDAQQKIMEMRPDLQSTSQLADKVLFCQPPGTGNWLAVAPINHWRINMNNEWCTSLSALMHEVGHTIGLRHSGEGSMAYGDTSGYMGYGDKREDYPRKCFNGYKNWELGWYANREMIINPAIASKIELATFVDYDKTTPEQPVILNVDDRFFLQYNRAKGFNEETGEARDKVTVTRDRPMYSKRFDALKAGDSFEVPDYLRQGKKLMIEVCEMIDGNGLDEPDVAVVIIGLDESLCNRELTENLTMVQKMKEAQCFDKDEACSMHPQCCGTMKCLPNEVGNNVCKPCRKTGRKCSLTRECCGGLTCRDGECVP